ncbi:hypothetical protein CDL15_Pgr002359 [Punica granatum]|nr:hypothetical protein CDL15_Pgr002359 [Punica granatum]
MASPPSSLHYSLLFFSFVVLFSVATLYTVDATVPAPAQFKLVNSGDFDMHVSEYDANYRLLNLFSDPFVLCFYNTPNAFTLAVRMGLNLSTSLYW